MIRTGDQEQLKKITALKKKATYVREDILADFAQWCSRRGVRFVSAFMEAEWELTRLEADGIIDAIVSEDSDFFVLGSKVMIQLLDITIDPAEVNCSVVKGRTWYEYVNNIIANPSRAEMADFAVLLGVDYLDRAYGNSVNKVKRLFPDWRTCKEEVLSQIESNSQVRGKRSRAGIPGYIKTFKESSNIFQFAPCFIVESVVDDQSLREAFWSGAYNVIRGNLMVIPVGSDEQTLFGFDPDDILPTEFGIKDLFDMKTWIRTSCPVENFVVPHPRNDKDEILPWGCLLDFEAVPILMQPSQALVTYLESRGLSPRASNTREQLISAVERVASQGERGPPILPSTDVTGSGHYINLEVLTCNEPLIWEINGEIILNQVQKLRTKLDEAFIDNYFGVGRNGVRERAWGRITGGHFDLKTLQSTECNCRTPDGIERVRMLSIRCTPSMKKDVYTIYLVLILSSDTFLPAPASRCNCPVGRLFCSHMLAFIVLLGMMQTLRNTENFDWFESNMPDPVKSLHSLCIPFQYVF